MNPEALKKIKVIFMGSADFSVPILLELIKKFTVQAVITEIDKPAGRGRELVAPPTKILAGQHSIPCFQPLTIKKNLAFFEKISRFEPDVIIVAAYGKILPPEFLNLPKHGCLNVHPSLLPQYRGSSPIQTAILNGDKKTGVSIILMDPGMDTGDIIIREELPIENGDDYISLAKKLSLLGAELLTKIMGSYLSGEAKLKTQNDSSSTYTYKINKADGRINWTESSKKISDMIRAYCDWPISYSFYNGKKLEIIKAEMVELKVENCSNGQVVQSQNKILVKCGDGFLRLDEVKLEGKKQMTVADFVNGQQRFVGSILD